MTVNSSKSDGTNSPSAGEKKLAAALRWAALGIPVFPLESNGKTPLPGSNGLDDATTDPDIIREIWLCPMRGTARDFNIGARPVAGVHLFLDLDMKNGLDGIGEYEKLGGRIAGLVISTPSGGRHVIMTGPDTQNTAGKVAPGVDSRGSRGYCVAPGSTIDNVAYTVIEDGPMLPAPGFLLDFIPLREERTRTSTNYFIENDSERNVRRAVGIAKAHESAVTGTWHHEGYKLGCELARCALSPEMAVEVALKQWQPRGTGFMSQSDFEQDILEGYRDAVRDGDHGVNSVDALELAFSGFRVIPESECTPSEEPETGTAPPEEAEADNADTSSVSRRKLLTPTECEESSSREYVIKGVLARGDVGLVIGPPGAGKSSVVPMMAYNLALGRTVFGRRTRQGGVLYLAAEDEHGMRGRVSALKKRLGDAAPYFHLIVGVKDLYNAPSGDADWLTALAHERCPALVIIDTLAAAFPGLRENESDEMNRVVVLARKLTLGADGEPGPAVLICVHPSKSDPTTARGHTSLPGDADVTMILIKDAETDIVDIAFGKNRNGPCYGQNMAFRIESEAVGVDCDGDTITVPVGVEVDPADLIRTEALSPTEKYGLAILQDLVDARGPDVIADIAATMEGVVLRGMSGVSEAAWRDACEARDLSPAKQKASRTRLFARTKKNLLRKGAVKALHGTFWVADAA